MVFVRCPRCGAKLDNNKKCVKCGTDIEQIKRVICRYCDKGVLRYCPKCKHEIEENILICTGCGYDIKKVKSRICSVCDKIVNFEPNGNSALKRELIKCPECGKEVSCTALSCPHCGFQLIEEDQDGKKNGIQDKKKNYIGIAMLILACALFIFAIKNITNDKYKFYVENYGKYVAEYEENSNISNSYSGGLFRSGYRSIASSYKKMADEAEKAIWSYRIKAIVCCGAGVVLIVFGKKKIKQSK